MGHVSNTDGTALNWGFHSHALTSTTEKRDLVRIRRSRLKGDFLQVPNATVRDDRLSHMARGILCELLSRPDGWETTCDAMWQESVSKHGKASPGRRAFRAAFAELKEHGYLTSERIVLGNGRHGTVLAITDIPAGHTDVPHAGMSVPPAQTGVSAGGTDVPHAGTSAGAADVPHAGTSVRPAETNENPGQTDVPAGGTPASPAETHKTAGRTDVPHAGTSSSKHGENTGGKTSSSTGLALPTKDEDEDLTAFGAFWLVYPKSRDRRATLAAWREARAKGVSAERLTAQAQAYARERAGEPAQFTKLSANWLRDERYEDDYAPEPTPDARPRLRALPTRQDAALAQRNASRDFLDQLAIQLSQTGEAQ